MIWGSQENETELLSGGIDSASLSKQKLLFSDIIAFFIFEFKQIKKCIFKRRLKIQCLIKLSYVIMI